MDLIICGAQKGGRKEGGREPHLLPRSSSKIKQLRAKLLEIKRLGHEHSFQFLVLLGRICEPLFSELALNPPP